MTIPATEALAGIPVLVRVAETESFTEAARQLGISPSGVSKTISRLEERLGVRLFDRTTRRVSITEEGQRFYNRCRQILADIEEAQVELTETKVQARGTVLASVPAELGRLHIVPALPTLLDRYPDLEVKIELTDRRVDLIGERVDVAVRFGEDGADKDRRLVRRKIARSHGIVCASPDYIRKHGRPRSPEELAKHNVYFYGPLRGEALRTWQFYRGEEKRAVPLRGNVTVDSGDALVELAQLGGGVIGVFDFLANPAIRAGKLQPLLSGWRVWQPMEVSLVYAKHRQLSAKVICFADFVEEVVARALQA